MVSRRVLDEGLDSCNFCTGSVITGGTVANRNCMTTETPGTEGSRWAGEGMYTDNPDYW